MMEASNHFCGRGGVARKSRVKFSKKAFSEEDVSRAAGVAAGLEASFTVPAPPGAMAPAPLLDEIREMGEVGTAGVLNHLSSTSPEGRVPTLLALRALGDASVVPRLLSLIRTMRWSTPGLAALVETIEALDAGAELPAGLGAENLGKARDIAGRLGADEPLAADSARLVVSLLRSLPPFLQEVTLRDGLGGADRVSAEKALALAEAMAAAGAPPPAHFIEILGRMGTREAARALRSLSAAAGDKETLSRIRKAMFRLKNQGVEVEKSPAPPPRAAGRTPRPDYVRAVVSAVDGRGQMLVWIARSRVPRGRYLVQARLCRGRGIVELADAEMSAKELRGVFQRISEVPTLASQEVPAGYAVWLLERSRRENEAGETPLPRGFTHAKLMLEPLAEAAAFPPGGAHPVRGLAARLAEDAERMEVRALFSHRPFWGWAMDEERVAPYFRESLQAMESQVAMDERQQKERLRQIVENGAREIFREEGLRERIAGQLEDNGYIFRQAGDAPMARECVTLADEVRADVDGSAPLLVEMVQYSVSVMMERMIRQAREAGGGQEEGAAEGGGAAGADAEAAPLIITP